MTDHAPLVEGTNIDLRFSSAELSEQRRLITTFITETVENAGSTGVILGLSGGIDSTLVAYLAVEALGSDNVHGLILPSEVNPPTDESDAKRVATALDMPHDVIDIDPIVEAVLSAAPVNPTDQMAVGNVRVRTRAILNYYIANSEGSLVLGTGNRSEAATGYFTKYGDQAVDCNPIGNLYKCQVRQLAREMGVPENLVTREPTAAMWIDQTDEDEMGVSYDELDAILALHIDGPFSKAATQRILDVPMAMIDRVIELYEQSAHKRSLPPSPTPL